jgi:uncharacterized MnhB-related membrane protein
VVSRVRKSLKVLSREPWSVITPAARPPLFAVGVDLTEAVVGGMLETAVFVIVILL